MSESLANRSSVQTVARPLRLEYAGAVYHVTSRANARGPLFRDDPDRRAFLRTLAEVVARYRWLCHAYCLMDNHYHLLLETPRPNLALGLRRLNGVYAQAFNRRHRRVGHLVQGRYKAVLVERESHLLELCRYVVLNPVRARLCATATEWTWSSYRATAGEAPVPAFLTVAWVLAHFGAPTQEAARRYRTFVAEGLGQEPWQELRAQLYLGSEEFVRSVSRESEAVEGIPRRQCQPITRGLPELFAALGEQAILVAHREDGYLLRDIARHLGVHPATVGRRLRRLEQGPPAE